MLLLYIMHRIPPTPVLTTITARTEHLPFINLFQVQCNMAHEWLPEESLDGTLANLFLRSTITIALRWRNTVSIDRKHSYNEMFSYKEIFVGHLHSLAYLSADLKIIIIFFFFHTKMYSFLSEIWSEGWSSMSRSWKLYFPQFCAIVIRLFEAV